MTRKIIIIFFLFVFSFNYAEANKLIGILNLLAGAYMIYDGNQEVEIKTGTQTVLEFEWYELTKETHFLYLIDKITPITYWEFNYTPTSDPSLFYKEYAETGKYYDSFDYWHSDYYFYNVYRKYRTDPVLQKKKKSEEEMIGGAVLMISGFYLLFTKSTTKKLAEYLKKNNLSFNYNIRNNKILLSLKI